MKQKENSTFPGNKSLPGKTQFTEVFSIPVTKTHDAFHQNQNVIGVTTWIKFKR